MTLVTTHVLDTAAGRPAGGLGVTLLARALDGEWRAIADGETGSDGRLATFPEVQDGLHRLQFETRSTFFPEVSVTFMIAGELHLHIPILLSPFGYTTYRGS